MPSGNNKPMGASNSRQAPTNLLVGSQISWSCASLAAVVHSHRPTDKRQSSSLDTGYDHERESVAGSNPTIPGFSTNVAPPGFISEPPSCTPHVSDCGTDEIRTTCFVCRDAADEAPERRDCRADDQLAAAATSPTATPGSAPRAASSVASGSKICR